MTRLDPRFLLMAATLAAMAQGASSQPTAAPAADAATSRFDGIWDTTVTCSEVKNNSGRIVKGYVIQLQVEVKKGLLHGESGFENAATFFKLDGQIQPDGTAELAARGLTGDPDYTVGREQTGTPYVYSVKAHFDAARGSGKRIELRPCDLAFVKQQ